MDRLAIVASESQRLADVLSAADPDRSCPTCPDWTASDLLWHLTNVHFFWAGILERRILNAADLSAVESSKPARPEAMPDLLALREQATAALLEQLAQRVDDEQCWSWWADDQTVGFTRRMQTYEATMHRVDAELTANLPISPIALDVCAGAIDHAVDVMWGWMPAGASHSVDCVVEFVATDTGQRWFVEVDRWNAPGHEFGTAGVRATRATTDIATATVSGSVREIALWAWTRGGSVTTSGEPLSLDAVKSVVNEGIQ